MLKKTILPATMTLLLASCSFVPDMGEIEYGYTKQWSEVPGYEVPEGEEQARSLEWKTFFDSPELWMVIGTALQYNDDLKLAALSIEEARNLYRIERADFMPSLSGNGSGAYTRTPREASSTGSTVRTETYEANVGLASYELDFFGKIRAQNEAALNEFLATAQAQHVIRQSLIAETANAYLQLLADEKLLDLTKKTLEAQEKTYSLLQESLKNGVSTEQDVARAQTAVETARVNLHQYSRNVAQDKNALYVLMGVSPDLAALPKTTLDDVNIKKTLSASLPSEVLLHRPDIRKAEYTLLARNADIGAARAAFFPSITLTGDFGYASSGLTNLFSGGASSAYSFVPQISVPIFTGGRNKANLELAKLRKDMAIVSYEQAIKSAFGEVADELAARATLDEQLAAQRRLVSAAQKVYDISMARYESGIDSFLDVLDAQRELYAYQQSEIEIERQRLENLVNLYKVLGGGSY